MMKQITPLKGNVCPQLFSIFFSCSWYLLQTLFTCLGRGRGIFSYSLMSGAFSKQMKVKVLRSCGILPLKPGWQLVWRGRWDWKARRTSSKVLFVYLEISAGLLCLRPSLPYRFRGLMSELLFIILSSHWGFIQCTAKNHISLVASPVVV